MILSGKFIFEIFITSRGKCFHGKNWLNTIKKLIGTISMSLNETHKKSELMGLFWSAILSSIYIKRYKYTDFIKEIMKISLSYT